MSTEVQSIHKPTKLSPCSWLADDTFAVFLFHGVVERNQYQIRNYTKKHLTAQVFQQTLEDLKENGSPVSMDEIATHHKLGKSLPPRSFAITFDDGFENNYSVAAPILSELQVPATFYITTLFVQDNLMSWIDRIERCFEIVEYGKLALPWDSEPVRLNSVHEKITLLNEIRDHAKYDPAIDLDLLASSIAKQWEIEDVTKGCDPLDLKMNWEQVAALAESELFSIGGHTHTHQIMSFMDKQELEKEVKQSLQLLQQKCSIQTTHYSYPEGLEYCYNQEVIEVLIKHSIKCCPTAQLGVNKIEDDLFHLRRINVAL